MYIPVYFFLNAKFAKFSCMLNFVDLQCILPTGTPHLNLINNALVMFVAMADLINVLVNKL